jgi:hypothetical protein
MPSHRRAAIRSAAALAATAMLSVASPKVEAIDRDQDLAGASPVAIWQATNLVNPNMLSNFPTFVRQGDSFVGSARIGPSWQSGGAPIGVEITWTVGPLDNRSKLEKAGFIVPPDARWLVIARFLNLPAHKTFDAYTVVAQRHGVLVPWDLGIKHPDGTFFPAEADFGEQVFGELGLSAPITKQIVLAP